MARLSCNTKFRPIKRVWKSFSSDVRSLHVPTRIKASYNLLRAFLHRRVFVAFKDGYPTKRPVDSRTQIYSRQSQAYPRPAIYIHELCRGYEGEDTFSMEERAEEKQNELRSIEDAWRAVVASSPHLRVDERAEEFIKKFRKEIRMEKERSLLEFQEMMRSAR